MYVEYMYTIKDKTVNIVSAIHGQCIYCSIGKI